MNDFQNAVLFSFTSSGKDGKKIALIGAFLALGGGACLVAGSFFTAVQAVLQGFFVLLVVAALFLWIRYSLLAYRYEAVVEDGRYYLQIVQVQKARQNTLIRINVKDITNTVRYESGKKPERALFSRCYTYNTAIFSETAAIFVQGEESVTAVVLEWNEAFFGKLDGLVQALCTESFYDPGAATPSEDPRADGDE